MFCDQTGQPQQQQSQSDCCSCSTAKSSIESSQQQKLAAPVDVVLSGLSCDPEPQQQPNQKQQQLTTTVESQWKSTSEYPYKDSNGIPVPQTFQDLIELIRIEMGVYGLTDPEINVARVQSIIGNYNAMPPVNETNESEEWRRFAFFDKYRYTRNLVDDGNGRYNLLLLCWGPGMQSPIHDHAGSHCILKIMQGSLEETLYEWPKTVSISSVDESKDGSLDHLENQLKVTRRTEMKQDEAGYMHDRLGIHRVANPSRNVPAVSLHLYSPPIASCMTFSENTGTARKTGNCVFYSMMGKRNSCCSPGLGHCDSTDK